MPELPPITTGPVDIFTGGTDQRWERTKWILMFCTGGGLAVVLVLILIWVMISSFRQSQSFSQNETLGTLKEVAAGQAVVAAAMKDAADSMKDSAESQGDFATAMEKLTITIESDQKSDEALSEQILHLLERFERDEEEKERATRN